MEDDRNFSDDDTIKRIERYIVTPPENSRIFTVRPAVADYLLKNYNVNNRPKKPKQITIYAKDMADDKWALTGDTVKFSDEQIMRDGQNRMMACVRSGAAFRTHFVFGISDRFFSKMDQGKIRLGPDVLAIAGFNNTTQLAAAVRWAHLVQTGRAKMRDTLRADDVLEILRAHYPDLPDFITAAQAINRTTGQPVGMVAALLYLFNVANPEKRMSFEHAWITGQHGGRFRPLYKMQAAIAKIQASSSGRVHDVVRAAIIIRAWTTFIENRKGTSDDFQWSVADDFPIIRG